MAIQERLAVVVHADVRDAERGALVHDLLEELHAHDALAAVHLVARAEHALRVADVRALDLDDLGQDGRAIASGRQQQPLERLRLAAQHRFRRPSRGGLDSHQFLSDAMTRVRISSSSTVGSYPTRARIFEMSGTRRGMSSKPAS